MTNSTIKMSYGPSRDSKEQCHQMIDNRQETFSLRCSESPCRNLTVLDMSMQNFLLSMQRMQLHSIDYSLFFLWGCADTPIPCSLLQSVSPLFLLHFCLTNLPLSHTLLLSLDNGLLHLALGILAMLCLMHSHVLNCFLLQPVSRHLLSTACLTYLPIYGTLLICSHVRMSLLPVDSLATLSLPHSLSLSCFFLQLESQLLL